MAVSTMSFPFLEESSTSGLADLKRPYSKEFEILFCSSYLSMPIIKAKELNIWIIISEALQLWKSHGLLQSSSTIFPIACLLMFSSSASAVLQFLGVVRK